MSMDEVLHNLWVGDLPGALDTEKLRAQKIRSVLTASRGRLSVHLVRFKPVHIKYALDS